VVQINGYAAILSIPQLDCFILFLSDDVNMKNVNYVMTLC